MCSFTIGSSRLGLRLLEHVGERLPAGDAERRFVRVDRVVLAEVDLDADVLHRVAGDHAGRDLLQEALFDRRQEVAGDRAADDRVDPQEVVLLVVVRRS